MSTIYVILGILGWTASAVVIGLYLWKGKARSPHEVNVVDYR